MVDLLRRYVTEICISHPTQIATAQLNRKKNQYLEVVKCVVTTNPLSAPSDLLLSLLRTFFKRTPSKAASRLTHKHNVFVYIPYCDSYRARTSSQHHSSQIFHYSSLPFCFWFYILSVVASRTAFVCW